MFFSQNLSLQDVYYTDKVNCQNSKFQLLHFKEEHLNRNELIYIF